MTSALLPTYARIDLAFEKGEGAWLEASGGKRFLDFGGGIAVASLGFAACSESTPAAETTTTTTTVETPAPAPAPAPEAPAVDPAAAPVDPAAPAETTTTTTTTTPAPAAH